jgi:hypothetical protein
MMARLLGLSLCLCAAIMIALPASAEPLDGLQPDRGANGIRLAERQRLIVCGLKRGCRRITVRAGCVRKSLGGRGVHNRTKLVCGQEAT